VTDPHAGMPHEPAPPEPRFRVPPADQLVRGAALGGMAVAAAWLAAGSVKAHWALAPAGLVLAGMSVVAGWAAAIHLTGGEKFDDHPFV
jgi:hypothetical protein